MEFDIDFDINIDIDINMTDAEIVYDEPIRSYKINKNVDGKLRCLARVGTGDQCLKPRPSEKEVYCKGHQKHCPHGRFDGPLEGTKFLSVPKKRGPRFKNMKEYTLEELDEGLYMKTQLLQIDGENYLIDHLGVLYSNDMKCDIVGRREGNYITWFV